MLGLRRVLAGRDIVIAIGLVGLSAPAAQRSWAEPQPATSVEQQVAADRYVIRVSGGADDTPDRLRDRALLRAAQLTLETGGDWFEIVPRSNSPRARAVADTDFGLDYAVSRSCTAQACLVRATPIAADGASAAVGAAPIFEETIEIMIGSGEALEGGRSKTYSARDVVARLSTGLS